MSTIRVAYTKKYADEFDGIFRQKSKSKKSGVRIAGVCLCLVYEHCEKCYPEGFSPSTITDGYSTWSKTCPMCGQDTMEIVRIGKVQCNNCG